MKLAVAVLLALLAAACAGREEPLPRGVMAVMETEQTSTFVRNFNPLLEVGSARWPTRRAMYEPLAIWNAPQGRWIPWLAERWELGEGGLRWRFTIRREVKWSDGAPFRARDVVFTFQLLRRYRDLDARQLWSRLKDVRLVDDDTVDVLLVRPHGPSFEEIAQQAIVAEHVFDRVVDPVKFANESPVATGPFTEVEFFGAQAYQIRRNPHYWQAGRPAVEALRFRAHAGNEAAMLALLHDQVDWAGMFVPAIRRVFVARDPAHHHYWFPLLDATVFLYANTQRPPLHDVRVRKALSMAIDRARITGIAMHGNTRPADATGLSDAYASFRDPDAAAAGASWVRHDEAAAAAALDAAGCPLGPDGYRRGPGGRPLAFTIDLPAGFSDWISGAQMIARSWRRIGVGLTVRTSEYSTWFSRLQTGSFDLAIAWSDLNTVPYYFYRSLMSPATLQPLGKESAENWHRFGLPETDAFFAAIEAAPDAAALLQPLRMLQRLFVEHAPAIPLFPGPLWGQYVDRRFEGFPSEQNPYAPLSPNIDGPQPLLVLTRLSPR